MCPRYAARALIAGTLVSLTVTAPVRAQNAEVPVLSGYGTAAAAQQRTMEAAAIAGPSADTARVLSRVLSAETHVAGTPGGERVRDLVLQRMRALGLETEVRRFDVFLPFATGVRVWRTAPTERELPLAEPPVAGDPSSATSQYLTVNGYSAPGDVS
ncbi:MAG TPA: hypothetical protein VFP90_17790, partial [Gemmatimonadaceae bacterium]|nr:hypothetical protein [Gemmatimonadaceae bacterium]